MKLRQLLLEAEQSINALVVKHLGHFHCSLSDYIFPISVLHIYYMNI